MNGKRQNVKTSKRQNRRTLRSELFGLPAFQRFIVVGILLAGTSLIPTALGQSHLMSPVAGALEYDLWYTIDGGGVMFSTGPPGADFELSGTIAQADAGAVSGGEFELSGGFWFPLPLDDCNSDGWVNLLDYDDFDECLSGPGGGLPLPECNCFDLDGDDDIDLSDIGQFQSAFTGGMK